MSLDHFAFEPVPAVADPEPHPFTSIADPLGPLAALPGTWTGTGFNTIWRPHFPSGAQDRFLELNLTSETLVFEEIPGAIPNRGLDQKDIEMFGVHYMQKIDDSTLSAGIHLEPGIWATVPRTTAPQGAADRGADGLDPPRHRDRRPGQGVHDRRPADHQGHRHHPVLGRDPSTKGSFADAEQSFPELEPGEEDEVPPAVGRDHRSRASPRRW